MMSDADRTFHDEDKLPWLEAVDNEDAPRGGSAGAVAAALVAALVALGLVIGGVFWLRDNGPSGLGGGGGELIAAPAGPYKQRPDEPGGMKVEGQGDAAFAASAGADVNASIDIAALPEAPLTGAGSQPAADAPAEPTPPKAKLAANPPAPPPATAVAVAAPPPAAAPVAKPEAPITGGLIQLGAFSSEAKANQAWKKMSARFAYLKPLTSTVTSVKSGSNTLYRLRASAGGDAETICGKLKVAGETCAVL
jgi:cell division septation protein DedD